MGRGKSGATQTLNDFLPERRTDFVFAVLGEERGFVGAMLLLGLYVVVLWRVLRAIAVARSLYARLICAGVFGWLLASIFISVGMTIGIAPVTGIPLAVALGRRFEHDHGARGDRRGAVDSAARASAAAPAARPPGGLRRRGARARAAIVRS